jgi:hypothetical protein
MHTRTNRPNDPQDQPHLSDVVLDRAIAVLVPGAPHETCRILRRVLQHWHTAALDFLRSDQSDFELVAFTGMWLLLPAAYPPADNQNWARFMARALVSELAFMALAEPQRGCLRQCRRRIGHQLCAWLLTPDAYSSKQKWIHFMALADPQR